MDNTNTGVSAEQPCAAQLTVRPAHAMKFKFFSVLIKDNEMNRYGGVET
jgi:hypothetical protein